MYIKKESEYPEYQVGLLLRKSVYTYEVFFTWP